MARITVYLDRGHRACGIKISSSAGMALSRIPIDKGRNITVWLNRPRKNIIITIAAGSVGLAYSACCVENVKAIPDTGFALIRVIPFAAAVEAADDGAASRETAFAATSERTCGEGSLQGNAIAALIKRREGGVKNAGKADKKEAVVGNEKVG